jgi:hypothetical protein
MRALLAVTFASLLVGLATPAVLSCARWDAADAQVETTYGWTRSAAHRSEALRRGSARSAGAPPAAPGFVARAGEAPASPAKAAFRTPSGPAPSQAPPRAA